MPEMPNALFTCDCCGSNEDVHSDLSCPHCGPMMMCPRHKTAHAALHASQGRGEDVSVRPSTLTGFLLARIAEDEAKARRRIRVLGTSRSGLDWSVWGVTARRALAECESKRQIIHAVRDAFPRNPSRSEGGRLATAVLCSLALPYAAHPDCREEWRA